MYEILRQFFCPRNNNSISFNYCFVSVYGLFVLVEYFGCGGSISIFDTLPRISNQLSYDGAVELLRKKTHLSLSPSFCCKKVFTCKAQFTM